VPLSRESSVQTCSLWGALPPLRSGRAQHANSRSGSEWVIDDIPTRGSSSWHSSPAPPPSRACGGGARPQCRARRQGYSQESSGVLLVPFAYLGAKPVPSQGHSLPGHALRARPLRTLLLARRISAPARTWWVRSSACPSAYKALNDIGAFRRWFGLQPSTKAATLVFGFLHGFGLATKILDFKTSCDRGERERTVRPSRVGRAGR
jgi:hypothetical protein